MKMYVLDTDEKVVFKHLKTLTLLSCLLYHIFIYCITYIERSNVN
jgi:hypothetical protein